MSDQAVAAATSAGLRDLAFARHRAGDLDEAERRYRQSLLLDPAAAPALNGLAALCLVRGDPRGGVRLLDRARALTPANPRILINRGLAAADGSTTGRRHLLIALIAGPSVAALHAALAESEPGLERRTGSLARAAAIEPVGERLLALALAWHRLGNPAAPRVARRAVAFRPDEPDAANALGKICYDQGLAGAGARHFRRAAASRPTYAAAWANLALAHHDQGQLAAALKSGRRGLALDPSLTEAHANLGNALLEAASARSAATAHARALALEPERAIFLSNLLMSLSYVEGAQARQSRLAAAWWRDRGRPAERRRPEAAGVPLRVGYSSSFSLASTRHLGLAAIQAHDPRAIEAFAYVQRRHGSGSLPNLGPAFRTVRDITRLDDEAAAAVIAGDRLDLLVDLAGHTPGNRLGVFALKPAPTQATWIESFFTTGLAAIDWFITDDEHSPPGEDQGWVEQPLRLGRPRFCYEPPAHAPAPMPAPSRAKGYVTFGCFNYPPKIGTAVIALWAAILKDLPDARLRLKWWSMSESSVAEAIRHRFACHGVRAERLELAGASSHGAMLAEYGDIDVALDPFPFTGGVTTCEALWMGVPVVTLTGHAVVERQSAALLRAVGAGDLVAASPEGYRRIALAIAEDERGRMKRRLALREAMRRSSLIDRVDMALALEVAYRRATGADRR